MMPCSKFLFLATIFPKNVGGGGGEVEKKFLDIKKKGSDFSEHKSVRLRVQKNLSLQIPIKTWVN